MEYRSPHSETFTPYSFDGPRESTALRIFVLSSTSPAADRTSTVLPSTADASFMAASMAFRSYGLIIQGAVSQVDRPVWIYSQLVIIADEFAAHENSHMTPLIILLDRFKADVFVLIISQNPCQLAAKNTSPFC